MADKKEESGSKATENKITNDENTQQQEWNGKSIADKVKNTEKQNIKQKINESSCAVQYEVLPIANQNYAKTYNEAAQKLYRSLKKNDPHAVVKSMAYNEKNCTWQITFSNPKPIETLKDKDLNLGRAYKTCIRPRVEEHFLITTFCDASVFNEELVEELKNYGEVLVINRSHHAWNPTIEDGKRRIKIKLNCEPKDLPHTLYIAGVTYPLYFKGKTFHCKHCGKKHPTYEKCPDKIAFEKEKQAAEEAKIAAAVTANEHTASKNWSDEPEPDFVQVSVQENGTVDWLAKLIPIDDVMPSPVIEPVQVIYDNATMEMITDQISIELQKDERKERFNAEKRRLQEESEILKIAMKKKRLDKGPGHNRSNSLSDVLYIEEAVNEQAATRKEKQQQQREKERKEKTEKNRKKDYAENFPSMGKPKTKNGRSLEYDESPLKPRTPPKKPSPICLSK